jgi:NAD(P)H dehydrogenase (quinone)
MLAITGATGQLGLATLQALLGKVASSDVVAVVRNPHKAASLLPQGVTVRTADYNDPAALVAAFQGVEKVVLVSTRELDTTVRMRQHQNVLNAATQAGVRQVLYTSVLNPSLTSTFQASPSHLLTEEALQASGLRYTILRNTLYLDNLPAQVGNDAVASGKLYAAAGDGRASYGLRTEMGEILANVLTSEGHENQVYDIAPGPAYSFHDVATTLSEVTGQPIAYVPVSAEELAAEMRKHQVPELFANLRLGVHEAIKNGEFAAPNGTFEQLLGRKPTDLKTYLSTVYGK